MRIFRACSLIILVCFLVGCQPTPVPGYEPVKGTRGVTVGPWEDIGNISLLDIRISGNPFGSNVECVRFLAQEVILWEKSHTDRRVIDVDYPPFSDNTVTHNCATTIMIYSTAVQANTTE